MRAVFTINLNNGSIIQDGKICCNLKKKKAHLIVNLKKLSETMCGPTTTNAVIMLEVTASEASGLLPCLTGHCGL